MKCQARGCSYKATYRVYKGKKNTYFCNNHIKAVKVLPKTGMTVYELDRN
jgi:hypothetical protein